jgi:hypothetical protein
MDFRLSHKDVNEIKENLEVGGATPAVVLPNFTPGGH